MSDFSLKFQGFIDDMLNDIIDDLKENNQDYAGYRKYLKENCVKVRDIIDKLPKEERELVNEYESNYFNRVAVEQGEFYYRGFRDCVKLLKWLKVI